jgi:uracil phosphoribosyltransferase
MKTATVITHPLVQHNLTRLRDKRTEPQEFRRVMAEITSLLVYEATRSLRIRQESVETPLEVTTGGWLEQEIVLVPILRAGIGMLGSILELVPQARVGFIGLKREESTLQANSYLQSLPSNLERFEVIVIDPMLATGGSAVAALDVLVKQGARHLRLVNLLAAPEGIARVLAHYPDLPIFTAAIDRQLNERGYILPGLGDAGDRLFGT